MTKEVTLVPGPTLVWCDSDDCKTFRPATRLTSNEVADAKVGESGDSFWDEHLIDDHWDSEREEADPRVFAMGPHKLRMPSGLPALPFYRRVRKCSVCGGLIWTAEVNVQAEIGLSLFMDLLVFFMALAQAHSKSRAEITESL